MSVNLKYNLDDVTQQKVAPGVTSSDPGKGSVWDEVFYNESGADIDAGDWVVVDVSGTTYNVGRSIKESTTTADEACVGVALEAITDGTWGNVRRRGLIDSVEDGVTVSLTAATAEAALATNTTAGQATAAVNTDVHTIGICISTTAPVTVDVRC